MQRRCQEVIDRAGRSAPKTRSSPFTTSARAASRTLCPSWSTTAAAAALFAASIPTLEPALSPLELWCNEAQERYVLAIAPERLAAFEEICERERCPYAVVGHATGDGRLVLEDALSSEPHRHAAGGAARQTAAHERHVGAAPRARHPVRYAHDRAGGSCPARAASADRRRQDVPHHHRRSHRRRPGRSRSDGGPLAGAGGGRRRHRHRL